MLETEEWMWFCNVQLAEHEHDGDKADTGDVEAGWLREGTVVVVVGAGFTVWKCGRVGEEWKVQELGC